MTDQKDIASKDELVVPVTRPSEPQIIEEPVEPEVMPDPVPVAESGDEAAVARERVTASPSPIDDPQRRQVLNGWTIAALVASVLALAVSVFAWYSIAVTGRLEVGHQLSRMESVALESTSLRDRLQQLESDLTTLGRQVSESQSALQREAEAQQSRLTAAVDELKATQVNDREAIEQRFARIRTSLDKLGYEIGTSVDDWVLEETHQLLLLAGQRLSLSGDVSLARRALEIADQKLSLIQATDVLTVRRQLAVEIASLDAVPKLDLNGIVLKLSAMADQVNTLPLKGDLDRPEWGRSTSETEEPTEPGSLQMVGRVLLDDLGKLVRIRKVDQTRSPKLDNAQRFLAYEKLRLQLVTAQLAVLRQRPDLYQDSLKQARAGLSDYFAADERVDGFAASLESLKARQLVVDLPDLSGSMALLRRVIEKRSQSE
ncbi:MAG: uroporphyrinogen-III C-methyltransferase [Gammaproteobacteria bacterium]|nr:uroporphyrinogen-III C-methyltransferase [Gammaproteobacteria bacterium]